MSKEIESIEFGRIAAQTAKQLLCKSPRGAERAQVVEALSRASGQEIISGTVKKVTVTSVIVDLGNNAEAMLARETSFRVKLSVSAYAFALPAEKKFAPRTQRLILSRTAPEMLIELFRIEVPKLPKG